jgi:hypothetical protein
MRSFVGIAVALFATAALAQEMPPAPNGIEMPQGYKDWRVISVTERTDNNTLRVIIGNDAAMEAVRTGDTNPWPDGAILGKVVWNQGNHEEWETAVVPTEFRAAEFMMKDSARFADTGGWGFARWLGLEQKPFGESAKFAQECLGCHTPVESRDFVFTKPVLMP